MRIPISRAIDGLIDSGEGHGPDLDPFKPPLKDTEIDAGLTRVRKATFTDKAPPWRSPMPLTDTSERVPAVVRPPRRGRDWAVLVHPYGAFHRTGRLGWLRMYAALVGAAGFGVVALELPYHGGRRVAPKAASGFGFVRADLGATMRAVLASAAEVAAVTRWLRSTHDAQHVTGVALSLGGAALGLAAAHGAPVDAVTFVAAVDSPASFYATGKNRARRRETLQAAGYDNDRVTAAFAPVAPSTFPAPAIPRHWFIPSHDLVVPSAAQRAWCQAWGGTAHEEGTAAHGTLLANPVTAGRVAAWVKAARACPPK